MTSKKRKVEAEMGFSGKSKSSVEGWGMGLLLVFFPEDDDSHYMEKKKSLSSSASSSFKSTTSRCSSSSNLLLSKAQLTISICAFIVFFSLLLFTLCTFEPTLPTTTTTTTSTIRASRRWLVENSSKGFSAKYKTKRSSSSSSSNLSSFLKLWRSSYKEEKKGSGFDHSFALQRMGTLFRRGTKAMSDLVVGHLPEGTGEDELRLFMRILHRSGLTAGSDVVLIFPSSSSIGSSNFSQVILEENESFLRLVHRYSESGHGKVKSKSVIGFDVTQFVKSDKKEKQGEPLWGRRIHGNYSSNGTPDGTEEQAELTELNWGSVVSFDAAELDPEDSLAGFLDSVPMGLRRWACYSMLLGRVRRNFKHLMLVDVEDVVIFRDSLSRVRNRSPESVYLTTTSEKSHGKHSRKNSEKTQTQSNHHQSKPLTPSVIMGGNRGVRRLSSFMLTEIVRAAIQHKKKSSVSESGLLNQLVHGSSVLKNIDIITSTESIPEASSLAHRNPSSWGYSMVRRGDSNLNLNSIILKEICSSQLDSSVYSDC